MPTPSRLVLMTAKYLYDEGYEAYDIISQAEYYMYADEYFMVPSELAEAYLAARKTVMRLEECLEAWRGITGHRKKWHRRGVY